MSQINERFSCDAVAEQITVTVNPGFVPFAETDTVFVTAISVGMSPEFTDGTAGTLATSLKNASSAGGWVLLNSNDYNYNLTSSNNLIPALDLSLDNTPNTKVPGDAALAPLQLNISGPTNVGIWTFITTPGLRLWQKSDRTGAITTFINTALPTTIYVEGIVDSLSQGDQTVTLKWQDTAAGTSMIIDQIKETVFEIQGPQNVPGYGIYHYGLTEPNAAQAPIWSATGGIITADYGPANVDIQWNGGPTAGIASVKPAVGFSGQWAVNVVEITVAPPAAGPTSAAGAIVQGPLTNDKNGVGLPTVSAGTDTLFGMAAYATVTATGPAGDRGVQQINVGFVQNINNFTDDGAYQDGKQLASSLDTIGAAGPILDGPTGEGAPPPPFNYQPVTFDTANLTRHITFRDSPGAGPPLFYNQVSDTFANGTDPLAYMSLYYRFELDICAQTTDTAFGANNYFPRVAAATWSFTGDGNVSDANGWKWTAGIFAGVGTFNAWNKATDGSEPVVAGTLFNTLLQGSALVFK